MSQIPVLLVDDNSFNREGLRLYLQREGYTVFEAGDEQTALELAGHAAVQAAVIDISIPPDANTPSRVQHNLGIHLARQLKRTQPALGIVLFSAYEDRGSDILELIRSGTRGLAYKLKGCSPSALLEALHEVLAGRVLIDPEVTNPRSLAEELMARLTVEEWPWVEGIIQRFHLLSPREQEVAYRLAAAHTTEGIANDLNVAPRTIEHHIGHVYEKLGLRETPAPLNRWVLLTKACMILDLRNDQA
jgi:two-component system, NarL family, nitrate/nitrite response regulator NarL